MKLNLKSIVLISFLIVATSMNAQDNKHEFRANLGIGIDQHLRNVQERYINDYHLDPVVLCMQLPYINQVSASLEYFNHINKHWAIGGIFGISAASCDNARFKDEDIDFYSYFINYFFDPTSDFSFKSSSQYLMPAFKYSWIPQKHFCLYSKAAIGIMHYKQDVTCDKMPFLERHENGIRLAYQFSPVGCEFGGERIRGFFELGYGKQGIYNAGILFYLNKQKR